MKDKKGIALEQVKICKTDNPYEIAEHNNINVFIENLGTINGYYNVLNKSKYIHINSQLRDYQRKVVCAHELGHAFMHHDINTIFLSKYTFITKNKYEVEANRFAIELLLSDDKLREYKMLSYTIHQIASNEYLPAELVKLKFLSKL